MYYNLHCYTRSFLCLLITIASLNLFSQTTNHADCPEPPTCKENPECDGNGLITKEVFDPTTCSCITQVVPLPLCTETTICDGEGNLLREVFDPTNCNCMMIPIQEPFCAANEIFDEDNCGCVPVVTEPSCDLISVSADQNGITINKLNAPIEIVQIFNESWSVMYSCVGNCMETETVPLSAGDYRVYVKLYNAQWRQLCSTDKKVTVPQDTSSTGTISCGEVKINTTDGQIELQGKDGAEYFYKVSRISPNYQSYINCTTACDSYQKLSNLPTGTYTVRAWNSNWQSLCLSKEVSIENSERETPTLPAIQTKQCGAITCTYGQGSIHLLGDPGKQYYFKINKRFDAWESVLDCVRDCGHEASVNDLKNGKYTVAVYNSKWKPMCAPFNIELTGDSFSAPLINTANKRTTTQLFNTNNIEVYPNPAVQTVFIDLKAYKGEKGEIQLINQYGQIVEQASYNQLPNELISLDIQAATTGLFFIKIMLSNERMFTKKILVNR